MSSLGWSPQPSMFDTLAPLPALSGSPLQTLKRQRSPTPTSPPIEDKLQKRKKQNREAAQKSRERRKDLLNSLSAQVLSLEEKNQSLQATVRNQSEQIKMLLARLNEHPRSTVATSDASIGYCPQPSFNNSNIPSLNATPNPSMQKSSCVIVSGGGSLSPSVGQAPSSNFESAELVSQQLEVLAVVFLVLSCMVHLAVSTTLTCLFSNTQPQGKKLLPFVLAQEKVQVCAITPNQDGKTPPIVRLRVRQRWNRRQSDPESTAPGLTLPLSSATPNQASFPNTLKRVPSTASPRSTSSSWTWTCPSSQIHTLSPEPPRSSILSLVAPHALSIQACRLAVGWAQDPNSPISLSTRTSWCRPLDKSTAATLLSQQRDHRGVLSCVVCAV